MGAQNLNSLPKHRATAQRQEVKMLLELSGVTEVEFWSWKGPESPSRPTPTVGRWTEAQGNEAICQRSRLESYSQGPPQRQAASLFPKLLEAPDRSPGIKQHRFSRMNSLNSKSLRFPESARKCKILRWERTGSAMLPKLGFNQRSSTRNDPESGRGR